VQQATHLIARGNWEARAFAEHGADAPVPAAADLEVRAFAAPAGINEDPVTGSLNASLAQWLIEDGLMPARYVAAQGASLGRAGRVYLERDAKAQVWVGGQVVTCVDGVVQL
jgi:PhzF family phenazine biosynthesis protein